MAHTKATGTSKLGRDSRPKRLGVKLHDGQVAIPGNIIVRQRGSKIAPGINTRKGNDDTIYAIKKGVVRFSTKRKMAFDNRTKLIKVVSIV